MPDLREIKSRGPVQFKLHIDHIDNEHGLVWALQYRKRYFVLKAIHCEVTVDTATSKHQPRAYLTGVGRVQILNDRAYIRA